MPPQTPPDDAALPESLIGIADEMDAGPPKGDRSPARRCIATNESRPQGEMIRFVLGPDGKLVPDLAAKLPGRGAWVTSSREAVLAAAKKGAFSRAFKKQVLVGPELADEVEALLAKRVLDGLGLAKRAGDLILGFDNVREEVRRARPACLIEAADGAADGRSKVVGLAKAAYGAAYGKDRSDSEEPGQKTPETADEPAIAGCFTSEELAMALGRERVIHACLKQGRFAQGWMGELARLSGFRRIVPVEWRPAED